MKLNCRLVALSRETLSSGGGSKSSVQFEASLAYLPELSRWSAARCWRRRRAMETSTSTDLLDEDLGVRIQRRGAAAPAPDPAWTVRSYRQSCSGSWSRGRRPARRRKRHKVTAQYDQGGKGGGPGYKKPSPGRHVPQPGDLLSPRCGGRKDSRHRAHWERYRRRRL